ncbi:MAG: hypothetical protein AAF466_09320 [Bacteroidota bacterium]
MKRFVFILLFAPLAAFGQFDIETRYFTMDANSLPDTRELSSFDIDFGEDRSFKKMHITDFNKVTAQNYWQAVDMMSVLEQEQNLVSAPDINLPKLNQKEFGFSVSVNGSNSNNGTTSHGVRNTVYQEARPVFFCSPSPFYYNAPRRGRTLVRY